MWISIIKGPPSFMLYDIFLLILFIFCDIYKKQSRSVYW